jgi:hypothetical protein
VSVNGNYPLDTAAAPSTIWARKQQVEKDFSIQTKSSASQLCFAIP